MSGKRILTVAQKAVPHIKKNDPLLSPLSFDEEVTFTEGELVQLITPVGQFLGEAYLAKQNKGIGWIYSWEEGESFDYSFFLEKFKNIIDFEKTLKENPMDLKTLKEAKKMGISD